MFFARGGGGSAQKWRPRTWPVRKRETTLRLDGVGGATERQSAMEENTMSVRTNALSSSNAQEVNAMRRDSMSAETMKPTEPQASKQVQPEVHTRQGTGQQYSVEELQEAVESLNQTVDAVDRALEFDIHQDTNRILVRVVDKATEEVIREVPPERVLDLMAELRKLVGLLVDEKV